jgi:FXSXX-COOH protein
MTAVSTEAVETGVSDLLDVPLDAEAVIGSGEYARIMRRVNDENKGTDTPVSAFNSSI